MFCWMHFLPQPCGVWLYPYSFLYLKSLWTEQLVLASYYKLKIQCVLNAIRKH